MKQSRHQHWAQHIETWKKSALSQQAYCGENNLSACQFSYWKHKLAKSKCTPPSKDAIADTRAFVPVSVANVTSTQGLTIHLPNHYQISGIQAEHFPLLRELIEVLP